MHLHLSRKVDKLWRCTTMVCSLCAVPKAGRKPANAFFTQALSLGDAAVQKAGFNALPAAGKTMALAAAR